MADEKPLQHQLHDLAHQMMDEIEYANQHLEQAHDALIAFVESHAECEPGWTEILLQKAGKLQAAAEILVATAEQVHDPQTWELPSFGDETNIARA